MQSVILYAHGGSGNHGCEAIVRSLTKLVPLSKDDVLLSNQPREDINYGLDQILTVKKATNETSYGVLHKIRAKLYGNTDRYFYLQKYRDLLNLVGFSDIACSIGGDNYCYYGMDMEMMVMRQIIAKSDVKTILMGCSVEPERLSRDILVDMMQYDTICCRESLTYDMLKSYGFQNLNLQIDSAFGLDKVDLPLPAGFIRKNTVGINVSPMIIGYEKNHGVTLQNYVNLIQHIIGHTDMQVALIPHVVWSHNDDREPLRQLYEMFEETGRVVMIEDHNAEELKGYIARCRFMVVARTHASIAAYSTQVPTLVVGYSVKARGIAKDIFGTEEHYVIPVQSLQNEDELLRGFQWLMRNEDRIRKHYADFMPEYIGRLSSVRELVSSW